MSDKSVPSPASEEMSEKELDGVAGGAGNLTPIGKTPTVPSSTAVPRPSTVPGPMQPGGGVPSRRR